MFIGFPQFALMTDFFALLNEPRRPWLDAEKLKSKFLSLSAEVHPDRVHTSPAPERQAAQERFTGLNTAYQILREPKDRLLHLLELELGMKPKEVQQVPPDTMDLFMEVGQLCREVDAFLTESARATSPLLKVRMFERGHEWIDKLHAIQRRIQVEQDRLLAEAKEMNRQWELADGLTASERRRQLPLERLEKIYRLFSFLARWTQQVQERAVQLSF